jgi:hypothetical protein
MAFFFSCKPGLAFLPTLSSFLIPSTQSSQNLNSCSQTNCIFFLPVLDYLVLVTSTSLELNRFLWLYWLLGIALHSSFKNFEVFCTLLWSGTSSLKCQSSRINYKSAQQSNVSHKTIFLAIWKITFDKWLFNLLILLFLLIWSVDKK